MRLLRGAGFPLARPGQVIGLMGGSFDPAHKGHLHITQQAFKRMGLDQVWWLVTPGNPLKSGHSLPLSARLAQAKSMGQHPRIHVSDLERHLGLYRSLDTVRHIKASYPGVRFVWLMGADNLAQVHRWHRWRSFFHELPIAVFARGGVENSARFSPAAQVFQRAQCHLRPWLLARATPPAWGVVSIPMLRISSAQIRASLKAEPQPSKATPTAPSRKSDF